MKNLSSPEELNAWIDGNNNFGHCRLIQFQIGFFGLLSYTFTKYEQVRFNIMIIILQHGHFDSVLQYNNKVIGNEC